MPTQLSNVDFQPNDSQEERVDQLNQMKSAIEEVADAAVQRVFTNSYGNPNGNQIANGAAVYFDVNGSGWKHPETEGLSNTGWIQMFA